MIYMICTFSKFSIHKLLMHQTKNSNCTMQLAPDELVSLCLLEPIQLSVVAVTPPPPSSFPSTEVPSFSITPSPATKHTGWLLNRMSCQYYNCLFIDIQNIKH